jgi:RNA polymerase sigma factor (sigma-70 family)
MSEPAAADCVHMGDAAGIHIPASTGALRSRRLLRLAGDDRLVAQIRRGSEAAFEVVFERHGPAILGFCRHMLGSLEEAEDAVQHTFAAAYRDLQRDVEREITLKPWLFTIARNRCLSILRARREQPAELPELATAALGEQVERRSELRELLADVRDLPGEQRAALLLAELGDLSHPQIAQVLGCEVPHVKALVYRARSGLLARRDGREMACADVREQLANLRGGALRRRELRFHLRECPGCRGFREQVKRQRRLLAAGLPVVPGIGLKSSVLATVGIGGGPAAGAAGGAAAGGAAAGGGLLGGSAVAKIAIAAVIASGGTAAVVEHEARQSPREAAGGAGVTRDAEEAGVAPVRAAEGARPGAPGASGTTGDAPDSRRSARAQERSRAREAHARRGNPNGAAPGHGGANAGRPGGRGRGPIEAPPARTPVKRGPPESSPQPAQPAPKLKAKPPPPAVVPERPEPAPPVPKPEKDEGR